uniref:Uncharacterized protein n=2 Tax=Polytomella parva TaxID=51329 RepID=A0A7S0VW03_9CHLO|mmetsp:Transcript_9918/g.18481  ORF Transcript_9918/g.18481 Transcript_9918/m.18481 type:complete len:108 (+) Transcript_9918:95-418(+)|eukprot:CAMPEP_0175055760 /NCGR_PEP_ID=MMETSP0052_2-20121109/10270_1 /TAXON_ID=51329 ORGANISM="Polytomella parva, Strain SAG 63-3" /NCGR_SAMPLE_ID=MMETSP0052_2 /ASSEMBLY_ACC=CAM_ASM_000194 /LENGTH=107 /DNA_ID=CAMNT_0016320663 /DNA_START=45 /DNA_END=368 /DNA_ORIENTATION=-
MASEQLARWFAEHPSAPRAGRILEAPMSFVAPRFLGGLLFAYALFEANRSIFWKPPHTFDAEFQAEVAKIGSVAQRMNGSPVYLNPFRNRIPGGIVGPEDVAKALEA